jgi:hypothetical protein
MRTQAIINIYPDVALIDDKIGCRDINGNPIVVDEQAVEAEAARLQAAYDAAEYQRKRAAEYPSIADQLDTLYHGGYDAWKATVDAVKLKYPKPE